VDHGRVEGHTYSMARMILSWCCVRAAGECLACICTMRQPSIHPGSMLAPGVHGGLPCPGVATGTAALLQCVMPSCVGEGRTKQQSRCHMRVGMRVAWESKDEAAAQAWPCPTNAPPWLKCLGLHVRISPSIRGCLVWSV
jgi:hypothetical protein